MSDVTQILSEIEHGDPAAAERLLPLIYDELRNLAVAKLTNEKPGQTLQATALVHEAYIRLVDLDDIEAVAESRSVDLLALDEALTRLAAEDPVKAQLVSLRYFGGLSLKEIAAVLDVSERTVGREWQMAKAWLRAEVRGAT